MYTFSLVQWAIMPWLEEASLSLSWLGRSYGSMEERRNVGGLRDKGSQGTHGKHNSMQGKCCLRVTPHPPFIAFLGIFRVLSPWLGL